MVLDDLCKKAGDGCLTVSLNLPIREALMTLGWDGNNYANFTYNCYDLSVGKVANVMSLVVKKGR